MSFTAQETQPLLNDPAHPGRRTGGRATSADSSDRALEAAHPTEDAEKDERGALRMNVDRLGYACVLAGLGMFLPLTQYIVFANGGSKLGWFALHPTMQSVGITAAVLSIQALQTTPSAPGSRAAAFRQHQILLLALAIPVFAIGVSAMWYNKASHGAKHFTTAHGKMGAVVVGWMLLQAIIGALAHSLALSNPSWKRAYKYHRASGYVLLPLVLVTAHLGGAWSDWAVGHSSLAVRVVAFDVGLGLVAAGVVMRMRPSKMKFL